MFRKGEKKLWQNSTPMAVSVFQCISVNVAQLYIEDDGERLASVYVGRTSHSFPFHTVELYFFSDSFSAHLVPSIDITVLDLLGPGGVQV